MQTERITFLTTPDHKAALDAFARKSGMSIGHVVREATSRYIALNEREENEYEQALNLIMPELETALVKWNRHFDSMEASLDTAHQAVSQALADVERTK